MSRESNIEPAALCGGVFIDDMGDGQGGFVPVHPMKPYHAIDKSYVLHEYAVSDRGHAVDPHSRQAAFLAGGHGQVRACLVQTLEANARPGWEIAPDEVTSGYYEAHRHVAGVGRLLLRYMQRGDHLYFQLPQAPQEPTLYVGSGDAFRLYDDGGDDDERLAVLATFPGRAFQPEFEQFWPEDGGR